MVWEHYISAIFVSSLIDCYYHYYHSIYLHSNFYSHAFWFCALVFNFLYILLPHKLSITYILLLPGPLIKFSLLSSRVPSSSALLIAFLFIILSVNITFVISPKHHISKPPTNLFLDFLVVHVSDPYRAIFQILYIYTYISYIVEFIQQCVLIFRVAHSVDSHSS